MQYLARDKCVCRYLLKCNIQITLSLIVYTKCHATYFTSHAQHNSLACSVSIYVMCVIVITSNTTTTWWHVCLQCKQCSVVVCKNTINYYVIWGAAVTAVVHV